MNEGKVLEVETTRFAVLGQHQYRPTLRRLLGCVPASATTCATAGRNYANLRVFLRGSRWRQDSDVECLFL